MDSINIEIAVFIAVLTVLLYLLFSAGEDIVIKMLFGFLLATTFIYSGWGIAFESVPKYFIWSYFSFCFGVCIAIKFIMHTKLTFNDGSHHHIEKSSARGFDFDYNNQVVTFLALLFILTSGLHLLIPKFNLFKLFSPGPPSSELIYARRAAASNNVILRIASTINIFCLSFFCMYLKKLVDQHKKFRAIFLVLLWMYLDYLEFDYLSRYQMLIFAGLAFCIGAFVYPEGIIIKKKYVLIAFIAVIMLVPFLNAYVDIRNGSDYEMLSIGRSLVELIESEIYYPKNYPICVSLYGTDSILNFVLWLICLPIPSVLFPWKPTVTIAYSFTYALTGLKYGAQAYYSSSLPSVVGEGIILWGPWLVGFHGLLIGVFIGAYFKFIRRFNTLSVLNIYMLLMILTIGRGGASSYMSTLINGTFSMLLWGYLFNKIHKNKNEKEMEIV